MRSVIKLTKGELYKLIKSKTLYIMSAVLAVVIGLFTILYINLPTGSPTDPSSFMSMMMGKQPTAFALYDSIYKQAVDNPAIGDDLKELSSDEWSKKIVATSPYKVAYEISPIRKVMKELGNDPLLTPIYKDSDLLTFVLTDGRFFQLSTVITNPDLLVTLIPETPLRNSITNEENAISLGYLFAKLDQYTKSGLFTEQELKLAVTYSTVLSSMTVDGEKIQVHKTINDAFNRDLGSARTDIAELTKEIAFFKDSGFTKTNADYVELLFEEMTDSYINFLTANKNYEAAETQATFDAYLNSFVALNRATYRFNSAYDSNMTYYGYLLYEYSGNPMDTPAPMKTLKPQINKLVKQISDTTVDYNKLMSEQSIYNLLVGGELLPEYGVNTKNPSLIETTNNDAKKGFLNKLEVLVTEPTKDGGLFAEFKVGSDKEIPSKEGKLVDAKAAIQGSTKAVISEDFYNKEIAPYENDIQEMDTILKSLDGLTVFSEFRRQSEILFSKDTTFRALMYKLNAKNVIKENGLDDAAAKKLYGMMFGSRYAIDSNITEAQYFLAEGKLAIDFASPTALDNGYGFMNFAQIIVLLLILIFAIVIASSMIAGEHGDGTMKLLLIRPHTKSQVLTSKILTIMIVTFVFLVLSFIATFVIGAIGWGVGGKTVLAIFNANVPLLMNQFSVMLLSYGFAFCEIMVYALISLMVSTIFKSRSGAVSISMVIYFAAQVLSLILGQYSWYKFILFNNTNLFAYFTSGPSLNDMNFVFSLVVTAIYTFVIVCASYFTFNKRDAN